MLTPLEPIRCGSPILSRQEIKVKEFLKLFLAFLMGFCDGSIDIGKGIEPPSQRAYQNKKAIPIGMALLLKKQIRNMVPLVRKGDANAEKVLFFCILADFSKSQIMQTKKEERH